MRSVVPLGVNTIELAHARAQVAIDRLDDDVKVVVHQAIRVAQPVVTHTNLAQQVQPALTICIVQVNVFAPVATRGDVIQRAGEF